MDMTAALPSAAMELGNLVDAPGPDRKVLFPWWHAVLVDPNRERRAAEWLVSIGVNVYWPHYTKQVGRRRSGQKRRPREAAAIPGMLFAPCEFFAAIRRDVVKEFAHIRGFMIGTCGEPGRISKAEMEKVRRMEAKLNLPPEAKGVLFKTGERVRFADDLYTDWGTAIIFEIASEARIGVEVASLFGRATRIWVPASEIEAM